MTLDDVVEASAKIAAPAVEAALLETHAQFALDTRALRQLDAADVPDSVVDVMVALSFPDRFQLARPVGGRSTQTGGPTVTVERSSRFPSGFGRERLRGYSPYYTYDPYYPYYPYDPHYPSNPYDVYGSYNPYYFSYSPFGYSNWWGGRSDPYYSRSRRGPRSVVTVPGGPARPSDSNRSRVIEGRGYTQGGATVAPDAPDTGRREVVDAERNSRDSEASGSSSRRAVSRQGYSTGGSSSGGRSGAGGGSASGGGSRSGGSDSAGSGSRSRRTAQPR